MAFRRCATDEYNKELMAMDPAFAERRKKIDAFARDYVQRYAAEGLRIGVVQIPVVVHVVWKNADQNISDAQIQSQIDRLNIDSCPTEFYTLLSLKPASGK